MRARTQRRACPRRERGQAVVEMALIVPLLVACVMGGLDLSVQAVCARQAQTAAQAAANEAAALLDQRASGTDAPAVDEAYIASWLSGRYPLMDVDGLDVEVTISAPETIPYSHKIHASKDSPAIARQSNARRGEVTVELSFPRKYVTPIGSVFSAIGATGVPDGFTSHGKSTTPYDLTGQGW